MAEHLYELELEWTGNTGSGTSGYRDYERSVVASSARAAGPVPLLLSADKTFRGDASKWNPEELLVAALSECHLLSYLHVCVMHGVVVTAYADSPQGVMRQEGIGGRFEKVTLRPRVTIADPSQADLAHSLHQEASQACFIASSVNFPVLHEPVVTT